MDQKFFEHVMSMSHAARPVVTPAPRPASKVLLLFYCQSSPASLTVDIEKTSHRTGSTLCFHTLSGLPPKKVECADFIFHGS